MWLGQFDRVKTLQRQGMSMGTISKETGLNLRTVAKWAKLKEFPERRSMSPKSTTPRKYESYLAQRNGQTEGYINRLKTLKRQMYGRAGTELLRARLLPVFCNDQPTN